MNFTEKILVFRKLINDSDAILIGLGSGMSASGGLDYTSIDVLKDSYNEYYQIGYNNIFNVIQDYWVTNINKDNEKKYWDFWTLHTNNIRYKPDITEPYRLLYDLVKHKNHFVITTNGDGQTQKIFNNVYAPQGDYSRFQCRVNCSNEVYDNKNFITSYLDNEKSIPMCKKCGDYLIPNLRCDNYFCESKVTGFDDYYNFILNNKEKKLLLIEVGVGFNTPGIIRYPFDQMSTLSNVNFVRINKSDSKTSGIGFDEDVLDILKKI